MSVTEKAMLARGIGLPVVVALSWLVFPVWLGLAVMAPDDATVDVRADGNGAFEPVGFGWRVRHFDGEDGELAKVRGLAKGDIVVAVNEHRAIASEQELFALLSLPATAAPAVHETTCGGSWSGGLAVDVYRDGKALRLLSVEHDNGVTSVIEVRSPHEADDADTTHHGAKFVLVGVEGRPGHAYALYDLVAGSLFERAGVRAGDVLLELAGHDVTTGGLHRALHRAEHREAGDMRILRDGIEQELTWAAAGADDVVAPE